MASAAPSATVSGIKKPRLNFAQIFNMSFGFFGIQFGWDLQRANMGPIYEYLKASPEQIPLLFLAAPLTGLIMQPIIGYMSDRTWHPTWGRRRPYFFVGALLSTICLFLMPNSGSLWMAAGLLWILDTSGNIAIIDTPGLEYWIILSINIAAAEIFPLAQLNTSFDGI